MIARVISDTSARRKRRRQRWAIVRGLLTFAISAAVLALSAWLAGDLRLDGAAPAELAPLRAHPLAPTPRAALIRAELAADSQAR